MLVFSGSLSPPSEGQSSPSRGYGRSTLGSRRREEDANVFPQHHEKEKKGKTGGQKHGSFSLSFCEEERERSRRREDTGKPSREVLPLTR